MSGTAIRPRTPGLKPLLRTPGLKTSTTAIKAQTYLISSPIPFPFPHPYDQDVLLIMRSRILAYHTISNSVYTLRFQNAITFSLRFRYEFLSCFYRFLSSFNQSLIKTLSNCFIKLLYQTPALPIVSFSQICNNRLYIRRRLAFKRQFSLRLYALASPRQKRKRNQTP